MNKEWQAVFAQPMADEAKQTACLAVFRQHIGLIALSHYGKPSALLRFYLDMVLLRDYLGLLRDPDDCDRLVKFPVKHLINDWLSSNVCSIMPRSDIAKPLRFVGWPTNTF